MAQAARVPAAKAIKLILLKYRNEFLVYLGWSIYDFHRSTPTAMRQPLLFPTATFLAFGLCFGACKKETEIQVQVKEVEKRYSWSEVSPNILNGWLRIILSTGTNGRALYFQHPSFFTRFSGKGYHQNDFNAGVGLPTDISVRLPIGRDFTAYPASDSLLTIYRNDQPVNRGNYAYVHLRRLDPTATSFNTRLFSLSKCMAINENNYLLAPYYSQRPGFPITFLLAAVTPGGPLSGQPVVIPRTVVIPKPSRAGTVYVRNIAAIEDYFLVNLADAGIYKIKQDGTFRQVYRSAIVDAFYKRGNTVYAPVEYNEILTSNDNGDTWQSSSGTPSQFTLATYYTVRDSLVGVHFNQLFTLNWNGPRFTMRALKNDGLGRANITGVEYLRDTVYVATTSGLFARPAKEFFESKPQ